jgi:hypothetical protein
MVTDPLVLGAYAAALLAALLLLRHVARRWPSVPARIPMSIGYDGRGRGPVPRGWIWFLPLVICTIIVVIPPLLVLVPSHRPPPPIVTALLCLLLIELAGLIGWLVSLQIELGRKMTFRIAPIRLARAVAPVLVTIAIILYVAVNP